MKRARSVHKVHEVGVRDLRANMRRWLDRVRAGDEVVITERGVAVARIVPKSQGRRVLDELVESGLIRPPLEPKSPIDPAELVDVPPGFSLGDLIVKMRG